MPPSTALPIAPLLPQVLAALRRGPVVVSAPTGSGKSTCVPPALTALGRVLVIEPRRVACRALAARVAELRGCRPGTDVGWIVRDERRVSADASITFVTPGVALRLVQSGAIDAYAAVVVDEFHERAFDTDLLLCLLQQRGATTPGHDAALVVMSATLQGDRLAAHLGGVHLVGEGRTFPIDIRWLPGGVTLPSKRGLEQRIEDALTMCRDDPGDVLIFLPGKGEIARVAHALSGKRWRDVDVMTLHGGMALQAQAAVLTPRQRGGGRRRVILSTNVAETSLTIPGIGVVIDSGLVRGMVYRAGRGYLSLLPIARDAADQRAGRAGRLGPGVCIRLFSRNAKLADVTLPEIHRGSLVPLTLSALACSPSGMDLPWLDPPKPYAVSAAMAELTALGCVKDGAITSAGRRLFSLPLDVSLARLLVEGDAEIELREPTLLLAAALSVDRPLFRGSSAARQTVYGLAPGGSDDGSDDPRRAGCDAVRLITAVRDGESRRDSLDVKALAEARLAVKRFRKLGFGESAWSARVPRRALAQLLMQIWPGSAHVRRNRKKGRVTWASGGPEMTLAAESAVEADQHEAVVVLRSRAVADDPQRAGSGLLITAAMPVPIAWLAAAGLGQEVIRQPHLDKGQLRVTVERTYAGKVLSCSEIIPRGRAARLGIRDLILAGRCFKGELPRLRQRFELSALATQVTAEADYTGLSKVAPVADLPTWLLNRLTELGLESGDDLALLDPDDIMPPALPADVAELIARRFPTRLDIGDARYRIVYDVAKRKAVFQQVSGQRKRPPERMHLPRLPGYRLFWEHKNRTQPIADTR